jgi:hypothetical protein
MYMLTTDRDQIPHGQSSFAPTLLDYTPKELTALRESDRIELARRIEGRVDDLGDGEELFTCVGDLRLCGAEEGRASMEEKGEERRKGRRK